MIKKNSKERTKIISSIYFLLKFFITLICICIIFLFGMICISWKSAWDVGSSYLPFSPSRKICTIMHDFPYYYLSCEKSGEYRLGTDIGDLYNYRHNPVEVCEITNDIIDCLDSHCSTSFYLYCEKYGKYILGEDLWDLKEKFNRSRIKWYY